MIEKMVDGLIDAMRGSDTVDLIADFAYPIGVTVICTMLGMPEEHRDDFRQWVARAMTPGHDEQKRGIALLQDYIAELIDGKRGSSSGCVTRRTTGLAVDCCMQCAPRTFATAFNELVFCRAFVRQKNNIYVGGTNIENGR